MKALCVILVCCSFCGTQCFAKSHERKAQSIEFRDYDKGGVFPEIFRDNFAHTLKKYPRGRFARAYSGERASMHRYFQRAQTVFEDGDDNEAMSYVLLKLFFGCHDFRFSRVLETEDYATRQAVGRLLDPLFDQYKIHAPLTRSNYHYRRHPRPREAVSHD